MVHSTSLLIDKAVSKKYGQFFVKRSLDIIFSIICLILFSPILVVVSVLIKLTSRGDVLYANYRAAYKGGYFRCYKFRSMRSDLSNQDQLQVLAQEQQQKGVLLKLPGDSRVTWIGKFIRKYSIDELPQLFNVLNGDMSLVGPRPLVPFMLDHLPQFKETRSLVRPGITGLWQIRNRKDNTSADFMIKHDLEYIREFSILLDFKILLATPLAVLKADGAY